MHQRAICVRASSSGHKLQLPFTSHLPSSQTLSNLLRLSIHLNVLTFLHWLTKTSIIASCERYLSILKDQLPWPYTLSPLAVLNSTAKYIAYFWVLARHFYKLMPRLRNDWKLLSLKCLVLRKMLNSNMVITLQPYLLNDMRYKWNVLYVKRRNIFVKNLLFIKIPSISKV